MTTPKTFCPYRQATLLQQALAPDKMRIAFLLGAGCPVAITIDDSSGKQGPLIPDVRRLTERVATEIAKDATLGGHFQTILQRLASENQPNIEEILSYARNLADVVKRGEIDGLTKNDLENVDKEICRIINAAVNVSLPNEKTPYHKLAMWIKGIARANPVEIFTPNYDVLMEQSFEASKTPYFDGFVGSRQAFFDLVAMETDVLPARWARLWKLHGSINWWRTEREEVVRRDGTGNAGDRQMIYPSHLKYDQSRRMPYLAMLDRLRDFLSKGQAVLITCGYSFSDQHLNEVITTGLRANPTAISFALMFGEKSQYPEALRHARAQPNLSVLAEDGAILGSSERSWHSDPQLGHALHGTCVLEPAEGGTCRFALGDFARLGEFLGQQLAREDEVDVTAT